MYEAVKAVKDWREFGVWLLGHMHEDKLAAIHCLHGTDEEACVKSVIEVFLRGEGRFQPSWRVIIDAMYETGENRIARDIIANAEPLLAKCIINTLVVG